MTLLQKINDATRNPKLKPLSENGLNAVLEEMSEAALGTMVSRAMEGDATQDAELRRTVVVGNIKAAFLSMGMGCPTLAQVRKMVVAQGQENVRRAMGAAGQGDANARAVLAGWIDAQSEDGEGGLPTMPLPPPPRFDEARAPDPAPGAAAAARHAAPIGGPRGQAYRVNDWPQGQGGRSAAAEARERWNREEPADRSRAPSPATPVARDYDQAKVHGGRAALTFVADVTGRQEPTVTIEAAELLDAQRRVYDWEHKLRFQLTRTEVQLVTALLLGMIEEVHFSNHGERNDKWLNIVRQDANPQYAGTIKVTMGQGKATEFKPRTVQMDFESLGFVLSLFQRQCCKLLRYRSVLDLGPTLRQVASAYTQVQARRQAQPRRA